MQSAAKVYDYLVIGAGSGGLASARRAAQYGKKVCLMETARLGGTCVNVGCVPKKVMFCAANFLEDSLSMQKGYGLFSGGSARDYTTPLQIDWSILKESRDAYVKRLNGIYAGIVDTAGIDLLRGTAKFVDKKVVQCGDHRVTADHILIASGSRPFFPKGVKGIEHAKTSDDFFALQTQPKRVLIVGSGYIGVELSGIFASLGTQVTLTGRGTRVLRAFDGQIAKFVQENMAEMGVNFRLECQPVEINFNPDSKQYIVHFSNCPDPDPFDQVIYTTGRIGNIDQLNLEIPKVEVKPNGFIQTDQLHKTSAEGVYAIGDVSGQMMLTPVAIRQGRILSDRLFNAKTAVMSYENIPTVIFSHPPIGSIGLSEEEAIKKYGEENIKIYRSRSGNTFYGPSSKKHTTLYKLVCLIPENERVIGLHGCGKAMDEIVQGFGVAMKMGATKADFDSVVAIHPTASEEFVTLR